MPIYICIYGDRCQLVHPFAFSVETFIKFIFLFTTNKLYIRSLSVFGFLMKFRIVCSLCFCFFLVNKAKTNRERETEREKGLERWRALETPRHARLAAAAASCNSYPSSTRGYPYSCLTPSPWVIVSTYLATHTHTQNRNLDILRSIVFYAVLSALISSLL